MQAVRRLLAVVHGFVSIEAAGWSGVAEHARVRYGRLIDRHLASIARQQKDTP